MAILCNYPKIIKLEKPNGIFLVFNDFEHEDDFPSFLNLLSAKLLVIVPEPTQFPYSAATAITLAKGTVTAMFHEDTGCCVLVPYGMQALELVDHIFYACYG